MSRDIIINQSKKAFIQAILTLLKNEDLEEISVKQLVLESGYSRRTYYRYFGSKTAILDEMLIQNFTRYRNYLTSTSITAHVLPEILINFIWPYHNEIQLLAQRQLFLPLLTRHITEIVDLVLTVPVPWRTIKDHDQTVYRYAITYSVGGFCVLLNTLFLDNTPPKAEKIIQALTDTLDTISQQI